VAEGEGIEAGRRRRLAAELYRPAEARLVILGEAPPPEKFFFYGDSLFFRYLRRAFASLLPEAETNDAGWFLALFCEMGGWRTDVCDEPQRATKGGAEDVTPCWEGFRRRWDAQALHSEAVVIVSPKRLVAQLPEWVSSRLVASVPPPGQWNAHREAFLRDMGAVLAREYGRDGLREAASRIDADDARLDFEVARACAEFADEVEILRLVRGHPRETALVAAWRGE
jgi:hypothetical protein